MLSKQADVTYESVVLYIEGWIRYYNCTNIFVTFVLQGALCILRYQGLNDAAEKNKRSLEFEKILCDTRFFLH